MDTGSVWLLRDEPDGRERLDWVSNRVVNNLVDKKLLVIEKVARLRETPKGA